MDVTLETATHETVGGAMPEAKNPATGNNANESSIVVDTNTSREKDSSISDASALPEDEERVRVEEVCPERDVVLDHMEAAPKRRLYRSMIEKHALKYRCIRRGMKNKFIAEVIKEMKGVGVRFLNTACLSPTDFGTYLHVVHDQELLVKRVQRCLREYLRKFHDGNKPVYNIVVAPSGSEASVSGASICSNTSTIATNPSFILPAQSTSPVKVIMHKQGLNMTSTTNAVGGNANTDASGSASGGYLSINQVSVSPSRQAEKTLAPSFPDFDAQILPLYDNHNDSDMVVPPPPKLIGGIESWSSLSGPVVNDLFSPASEPLRMLLTADHEIPSPQKRPYPADCTTTHQESAPQRRRISTEDLTEHNMGAASPMWVHISRHLAVLEHRLEQMERENKQLREMVTGILRNNAVSPPQSPGEEVNAAPPVPIGHHHAFTQV